MSKCGICGEPMPPGEEMFKFHGFSGPCPAPPKPRVTSTHTPGPWAIERIEGPYANIGIRVRGKRVSGYCAFIDTKWLHADQCAEQEANARLIAAAPDMYEALNVVAADSRFVSDEPLLRQIRAALAKAGGQP